MMHAKPSKHSPMEEALKRKKDHSGVDLTIMIAPGGKLDSDKKESDLAPQGEHPPVMAGGPNMGPQGMEQMRNEGPAPANPLMDPEDLQDQGSDEAQEGHPLLASMSDYEKQRMGSKDHMKGMSLGERAKFMAMKNHPHKA